MKAYGADEYSADVKLPQMEVNAENYGLNDYGGTCNSNVQQGYVHE